jgi:hypothetical protein
MNPADSIEDWLLLKQSLIVIGKTVTTGAQKDDLHAT